MITKQDTQQLKPETASLETSPTLSDGYTELTEPADIKAFLDAMSVKPTRKKKPYRKPVEYRHDFKARYEAARRIMWQREYPSSYQYGYYNKKINIETTNGFQNYIQDTLNNLGMQCERVNTGGVMRKDKSGQLRMCYSGSTKGSSDLHAIINGKAWKIEIKKGPDVLSEAQGKFRDKVLAAGGLHSVIYVGDADMFWDELDKYVKL